MQRRLLLIAILLAATGFLISQAGRRLTTGPTADGGFLLPSGWKVKPAGAQVTLETLPMAGRIAAGRLFILQAGHLPPALSVLNEASTQVQSKVAFKDAWLGLANAGNFFYVGGGSEGAIHEVEYVDGVLKTRRSLSVAPGGFVGDVQIAGDQLYATDLHANTIAVVDRASGQLVKTAATTRLPYRMRIDAPRGELWVTGWSDGEIWRHDLKDGSLKQRITVGAHAADQLWHEPTGRLFVAAANTNTVAVLSFNKAGKLEISERINVAMTPRQPVGMTPSALAFSPDRTKLYVACSDANAVAVIDIQQESRVLGYVPTGWYPTEVVARADGSLAILNGKGLRSHPNPKGPREQYVGRIQTGTVSIVPALNAESLAAHTKQTFENSAYRDEKLDRAAVPAGSPVPARPGDPSPIKHVIYVVKENRTYDQVFGDLKEGLGEPSLVMFGPDASANHRKLAREFTLLDNFYVSGDVSADGHQWSAAAIAPDYTQKLWPNMYAGRGGQFSLYWGRPPQGESEIATLPAGGYLWTKAFEAGRTVRNYGWFVKNTPVAAPNGGKQILSAESPKLDAVTSRTFRGYDLEYKDVDRMTHFLADLKEWETTGAMPQLTVMRLGNDHTSGARGGAPTPLAMFADNDLALGRLVEALSRSRFWKDTAVFVLEDDAQSGPDHIDSHRSIAFVISAYSKRKAVDSTMYNTTSMLRTMELILGLAPMTHFDAAATPMAGCFQNRPDLTPYTAVVPKQPLDQLNPRGTPLARRSERLDFREADRIPDEELNEILWLALKGEQTPMPAPARSRFSALR